MTQDRPPISPQDALGTAAIRFLTRPDGERIAYCALEGRSPTVVFLSGYASDMGGTKARYLGERCAEWGQSYLSLDYRGHGRSDGRFEDGTIGDWCDDARRVVETAAHHRLLLVGSSMGGWMMMLLARALSPRIAGLVGIAAAPDFTEDLMPSRLDSSARRSLARDGVVYLPSRYGPEPTPVTRRLLEEGKHQLVLDRPFEAHYPVRLIHGLADPDVPWSRSLAISECVTGDDVRITLLKGGAHRLSEPSDLALLAREVKEVIDLSGGS